MLRGLLLLAALLFADPRVADAAPGDQADRMRRIREVKDKLLSERPSGPRLPDAREAQIRAGVEAAAAKQREAMARAARLGDQLDALRGQYVQDGDLDALGRAREPVAKEALELQQSWMEIAAPFQAAVHEYKMVKGAAILGQFLSGGSPALDSDMEFLAAHDALRKEATEVQFALAQTRGLEEKAWSELRQARKAAARRRNFALGAAGALPALAGLLLLARRRLRNLRQPAIAATEALAGGPVLLTPAPQPARLPGPGAIVAESFRVVQLLPPGPLGPAFEAVELESKSRVFLKQLREELHKDEKDLQRFLAQARFAASLKHPNIVEIGSVFLDRDRVHLAMEFVAGRSLAAVLVDGALPRERLRAVLGGVAAAVEHAHGAGALHGDLRPAKVLLDGAGEAKVADFGLGLEARKAAAKLGLDAAFGSPAYLAPEQELGSSFRESDVYALGVMLYEMLTGRLPFEGPNFLAQKREKRFAPPSRAPGGPPGADAIVAKALEVEPQRRFHSAAELAAAVEKAFCAPPRARPS